MEQKLGFSLADKLYKDHELSKEEWTILIESQSPELAEYTAKKARVFQNQYYGKQIYLRALIELTSYCRNDCLYCGLRKSNKKAQRYRLSEKQILECAELGYELGYKTIVLQGGEDFGYSDDDITSIIELLRSNFPEIAITLSLGERTHDTYQSWFNAGADRYLLRHETANFEHYSKLHPKELSAEYRQNCLRDLMKIGYQTGTGFMVGAPYQTSEHIAEDMLFMKALNPQMVGIGPFIPHRDTPFASMPAGTTEQTIFMLSLVRLMLPNVLLPATTALGTIDPLGREKGVLAGANVIMPNISPQDVRKKYELYNNKICTGDESAEYLQGLQRRMQAIGYQVVSARGDYSVTT